MGINFEELRVGMVIESDIMRKDGVLILHKGTKLTNNIIEHLRRLGDNIKFEGNETEILDDVEETVNKTLRKNTEVSLRDFLHNQNYTNVEKIKENVGQMVEKIQECEEPRYDLEAYREKEDGASSHAVKVAFFSILLAKIYNDKVANNTQALINLNDIAAAALLQDAGVIYKDTERLNELTEVPKLKKGMEELFPGIDDTPLDHYDERYSSVYSYCSVCDMENISDSSKLMILLAKEPEDGTGPLKIPESINTKRDRILYASKIIRVCSVYDNSIKNAIDSEISLENVIAELGQYALNGIINNEIKELLIHEVKLYPYKTRVLLSNGEAAIVTKCRFGQYDSYKPVVITSSSPMRKIDLKETRNITIKSILGKEKFKTLIEKQIGDMKKVAGVRDMEER